MQRIKRFLALPAFWSSRLTGAIWPGFYESSGWNGEFDLTYMYRAGYWYGAACWTIALVVIVALIGWAL